MARGQKGALRRRLGTGLALVAASHFALVGVARADVASQMNGFFNDAGGAANVTGPTAFQGQSAGYYSLGNVWTRFPQKSVSPFNLQLPSARAGCGGIDLFAGSFSFINASEIVAMLKATANNALGFAFKLAIDSVSPEIGKVMDEFSQKAQLLNQMNISSCETAQALVGGIWPQMETTRSTICEAVGNSQGVFSDWAASRQGCNNGNRRDSTIAGNTDANMKDQLVGEPHNYTWEALKKSAKFGAFDQSFSEYIMTLVGTVVTTPSTDPSVGGKVVMFGPAEEAVVTALLDGTADAPAVKMLKCNDTDCYDVGEQTLTVPASSALRPRIAGMIRSMSSKIRTDTALDASEKQLLNLATVPLYKILSVQAYAHYALTDGEIETLSEIVAVDLLAAMLDNMLDRVEQAQTHYQTFDQATATQWKQQIAATRQKFAQRDVKLSNKLQVTMQIIDRSIMLESTLQNSMTPGMSSALNFSRGLNAQGLMQGGGAGTMLEVFTVGGGEYLVNTFNAVAAWSGGGGYRSLLRVVMVMGLIYSLLVVAFTMNFRVWMNWFLQSTAIYLCLMVPTIDVKVTDRINPSLAPATVANVPLGLGVLASFTTQIGDWLTRTAETVFVMPSELNYSTNGMVYGARLFDATRNFIIRDAEFSTNLEEHFKKCLFGDVMLYQKSLTLLAQSKDLWADIGPGSEARSQQWLERQGDGTVTSAIVTCRQAYGMLDAQWAPMIEANTPIWGKQLYPKLSNSLAADKLKHDLPIANAAFTGSGSSYSDSMRQNTAINAFMQARNSMAGGTGAATIDTFAQTRADIQARNTYNSIAQQAMAWVPILNIVLTVVFFAMFPVIFPLFLMPQTGLASLKGYAMGFFYLAAWGPLYVILHMICMTRAEAASAGVAAGGVTLGTYAGIGAVNGETATIAGFMLMSIPFLAAGLARGAMSIAGQATSMLAPAQNAAEAAALEQTTGNYSYGNVSWANATSNMRQSDQWSTAPSFMGGATSVGWRQDNGAVVSGFGNGQEVFDTSGAISRLGFTPTMSTGSVAEWREMANEAHRQAQAYENAAADILTATHANRSAFGTSTERSSGWESSSGRQANSSVEAFDRRTASSSQGLEERDTISQGQRITQGHDRQAQTNDQISGTISAGTGGRQAGRGAGDRGGVLGRLPSIGGSVSKTGSQLDGLRYGTDETRGSDSANTSSSGVRDEHASGSGATMSDGTYSRSGSFSRASATSSASSSTEDSLARAKSYSETARRLEELSQQLSRDASYAETHGMQLSENLSQDLAQWYRHQQVENPGLEAPELWATDLTDQQRLVRQEMITRWMHDKQDGIRAEIAGRLHDPDLVDVSRPSVSSAADVKTSYRPHGPGRLASGPAGAGDVAAAAIIEAGKGELNNDRAAAQTMRGQRVLGAVDLEQEVNRDHDRGFFQDPKLREQVRSGRKQLRQS